jgi:hypothetical protein
MIDDQVDWHILSCYLNNHEVVLSAANLTEMSQKTLKSLWLLVYLQHTQRRRSLDLLVADVHPGQIKQPHHGIRCRLDTCSWNRIWRLLPLFPHSLFPLPLFLTLFIPSTKEDQPHSVDLVQSQPAEMRLRMLQMQSLLDLEDSVSKENLPVIKSYFIFLDLGKSSDGGAKPPAFG